MEPRPSDERVTPPLSVTLRLLEIFMAVVSEGSFSGAASRLGLTHPAVSQGISTLEQILGVRLFDRSVRPASLTLDGQLAHEHALELVRRAHMMQDQMRSGDGLRRMAFLRIGMLDSFASAVGPAVLSQLGDIAEKWTVASGVQATSARSLIERQSDVVITSNESWMPPDVDALPVLTEPFILAVPSSWRGKLTSLKRLAGEMDFIRYSGNMQIRKLVATYLETAGVRTSNRYEFDTTDAALRMVAGGLGWTIITPLIFLKFASPGNAISLHTLPGRRFTREVVVATRRGEATSIAARVQAAAIKAVHEVALPQLRAKLPAFADEIRVAALPDVPPPPTPRPKGFK